MVEKKRRSTSSSSKKKSTKAAASEPVEQEVIEAKAPKDAAEVSDDDVEEATSLAESSDEVLAFASGLAGQASDDDDEEDAQDVEDDESVGNRKTDEDEDDLDDEPILVETKRGPDSEDEGDDFDDSRRMMSGDQARLEREDREEQDSERTLRRAHRPERGGHRGRDRHARGRNENRQEHRGDNRNEHRNEGRKESRDDRGGDRDRDRNPEEGGRSILSDRAPIEARPIDDYLIHTRFDKNQRQFAAECIEFPDLRAFGNSREEATTAMEDRLAKAIEDSRHHGENIPEPLYQRRYPDFLEVRPSQSLYRRLDMLSRQDRVSIEQLVIEMLSGACDRRIEIKNQNRQQNQQNHQRHGGHGRNRHRGGGGDRHRGHQQAQGHGGGGNQQNQGGGNRRPPGPAGRAYQQTMEKSENFLEYVRNLEKGNFNKKR